MDTTVNMNENNLLQERFTELPQDIQDILTDSDFQQFLVTLSGLYELDDTEQENLRNEIILLLMLYTPLDSFTERILEVSPLRTEDVSELKIQIQNYLPTEIVVLLQRASVFMLNTAEEADGANIDSEKTSSLQEIFPPPTVSKTDSSKEDTPHKKELSSQTEPAPQEPHAPVQAMRTMEGDMGRIHGYGAYRAEFPEEPKKAEHVEEVIRSASQHDLLQEKPKLAGMPAYEEKK